jgi:two-component system chemotaxis response regulator CheY
MNNMKKKVVIVDDYPNTRWVTEFTLQKLDVDTVTAVNGKEALQYFDGQKVDLLITDYNMPIMDGGELVKSIRENPKYDNLPILVLSTEKDEGIQATLKSLNISEWISKPFQREDFVEIVKKYID